MRTLHREGGRRYLEIGPHGVLSALGADVLSEHEGCAFWPTLHKGRDDVDALVTALGALHTSGVAVDWPAFFAAFAPRRVALPTYAFQRERYWLDAGASRSADVVSLKLAETGRPTLDRAVTVADADELTARLSLVDRFPIDPRQLSPDTTLVEAGLDSLGLANIKATLAMTAPGKIVAKRLRPSSQLAEILPFLDAAILGGHIVEDVVLEDLEWVAVDRASVRKEVDDNVLLTQASIRAYRDGTQVIAQLRMNPSHPFFYEHPLDHVPGLYLIEAARQVVNWITFTSEGHLETGGTLDKVEADFYEFIEHDAPAHFLVFLKDQPIADNMRLELSLFQAGRTKATFSIAGRRIRLSEYTHIRAIQRGASR
jgi:hypothetical protein